MKVCIAGSREFTDYWALQCRMAELYLCQGWPEGLVIISGGARGADALGERFAKELGCPIEVYPADWAGKGKAAGYIRNIQMAKEADEVVLFWDGVSKGTAHMLQICIENHVPVHLYTYAA